MSLGRKTFLSLSQLWLGLCGRAVTWVLATTWVKRFIVCPSEPSMSLSAPSTSQAQSLDSGHSPFPGGPALRDKKFAEVDGVGSYFLGGSIDQSPGSTEGE